MITKFKNNAISLLITFVLIQPIIDLVTGLMERTGSFPLTLGVAIRGLFVVLAGLYLVFFYRGKLTKLVRSYFVLFLVYIGIHLLLNFEIGPNSYLLNEIKLILKVVYLPTVFVAMYVLYFDLKPDAKYIDNALLYNALFYGLVIFLAQITGTEFLSYSQDKIGHVGWFYAANEIGAIIAILSPFPILHIYRYGIKVQNIASLLAVIFSSIMIGTKVSYIGVLLVLVSMVFYMILIIVRYKHKYPRYVTLLIPTLMVLFAYILPITPVAHNTNMQASWSGHSLMDLITKNEDIGTTEPDEVIGNLIYSGRNKYLSDTKQLFYEKGIGNQLFGIGFDTEEKAGLNIKQVIEMDYADLYYNFGILGLILFSMPFFFVCIMGMQRLIRDRNIWFVFEPSTFTNAIALLLGLAIAYISGHVLLAPSVANYILLFLLSILFTLANPKKAE